MKRFVNLGISLSSCGFGEAKPGKQSAATSISHRKRRVNEKAFDFKRIVKPRKAGEAEETISVLRDIVGVTGSIPVAPTITRPSAGG
jgi:hypothetical protein